MLFNGINKVMLLGYLGSNPEVITFSNDKNFIKINVATSSSFKNLQTQEWVKKTEWHQVILYNRFAIIGEKYLKKGSKVFIEGFLKTDKFEKNGILFFSTKIICNNILILNSELKKEETEPFIDKIEINEEEDIPF